MRKQILSILFLLATWCNAQTNANVEQVFVVFKTHLDVGFTDLSSTVTQRYMTEFIPKALEVSERLRKENPEERYVWTTGSWLIWKYLETASPKDCKRLEKAIRHGDIVWNGVPYTIETEVTNKELLEGLLVPAKLLDERFGKKTIAAKMTDVPGHTRAIITPFVNAGIRFLHVGVNPASPIPDVPSLCRWRNTDGKELILAYQKDYGSEDVLPDGKSVISINFTGDNHGPHTYEQVKAIYKGLHERYPNARLKAVSFNEIAEYVWQMKEQLPVVSSEIGDTWIYGMGSAPVRMAKFRALSDLYAGWVKTGQVNPQDKNTIDFLLELGLIAEHTQGVDVKTHLRNWDKYDMDMFSENRNSSSFLFAEQSWKEIDNYIGQALSYLPENLREEAGRVIEAIDCRPQLPEIDACKRTAWTLPLLGGSLYLDGLFYTMYDSHDYDVFLGKYLRNRYDWALQDLGKQGLENSGAVSVSVRAQVTGTKKENSQGISNTWYRLEFPDKMMDKSVFPEQVTVRCRESEDKKRAEVEVTVWNKPAVRLPEAYWLSFRADSILSVMAEKTGEGIDLTDVVKKGSRRQHGIDRYIDLETAKGKVRIWSKEAFFINLGAHPGLNYDESLPDLSDGVSFNLSNNLWGTNYSMWNEGTLTYHFVIEKLN